MQINSEFSNIRSENLVYVAFNKKKKKKTQGKEYEKKNDIGISESAEPAVRKGTGKR